MDPVSVAEVASIVGGAVHFPREEREVGSVAIHSDRLQADSLFFALQGATDGHRFVARALANGAIAAVVAADRLDELPHDAGPLIAVADPLAALQEMAVWWRRQLTATTFVAVVGSNGKTLTKDALVGLLPSHATYASPGSYNSQLGVALSVLQCPADVPVAVIEAAATEPGEMARLARIVAPDAVVFTNLGSRSVQSFGSREEHARELLTMAAGLPADGWLLMGETDPGVRHLAARITKARLLAAGDAALPRLTRLRHVERSSLVRATLPGGVEEDLLVATPSPEVLIDLELAMGAATLLGEAPDDLLAAVADYTPPSTRMQMWRRPDGATVVGELANTDPLALSSALRTARSLMGAHGRTLMIIGDPLTGLTGEAAEAMARCLRAENVELVCGLTAEAHGLIEAALTGAEGGVPVHRFPDEDRMRAFVATELRPDDVALVHVPRDTMVTDSWMHLVETAAATRLYVDLAAVKSNVAAFRKLVGPHTKLMGVVKAEAYGTNPVTVAHTLREAGVDWLGVATADEGIALRRAGVQMPILVFLAVPGDLERLVRHRLTPSVYSTEMYDAACRVAAGSGRRLDVHLEVDSGMHRSGFYPEAAIELLGKLRGHEHLRLAGLMSHLGCPDDPAEDDLTREQLKRFGAVCAAAAELGFEDVVRHTSATAATIRFPEARYDMVRIGLGLYGLQPSTATSNLMTLTPGVGLVSRIVEIHDMTPGERVGYGGHFRAQSPGTRVALIAAGYYDAVPRAFRKVGFVLVNGRHCKIAGTISMDSMAIEITGQPDAEVGSDVLIFGQYAGFSSPIEEAAAAMDTVSHELLTQVGPRVQRIFTQH
ncbi:alanine racemase [Dactylosporangium sp. NPDC051485]|uniref:alanine racemase n=1 Tax=Dactylosporangium sp. NPDC051485 TaxID=3154846 RepID=UPI0034368911